jgi:hypothetical protein
MVDKQVSISGAFTCVFFFQCIPLFLKSQSPLFYFLHCCCSFPISLLCDVNWLSSAFPIYSNPPPPSSCLLLRPIRAIRIWTEAN